MLKTNFNFLVFLLSLYLNAAKVGRCFVIHTLRVSLSESGCQQTTNQDWLVEPNCYNNLVVGLSGLVGSYFAKILLKRVFRMNLA